MDTEQDAEMLEMWESYFLTMLSIELGGKHTQSKAAEIMNMSLAEYIEIRSIVLHNLRGWTKKHFKRGETDEL